MHSVVLESFTFSVASNKKEFKNASRAGADLIYFEAKGFSILIRMKKGFGDGAFCRVEQEARA